MNYDVCEVCKERIIVAEDECIILSKPNQFNALSPACIYYHPECYKDKLQQDKLKFFSTPTPRRDFKQTFDVGVLRIDDGNENVQDYKNANSLEIINGSKMIIDYNPDPKDDFSATTAYIDLRPIHHYYIKIII